MQTPPSPSKAPLANFELGAAISLTAVAAYLHARFLLHAGGLWRDEVVSFNVATQPSLVEMHQTVRFDSFPSFFHLLLRGWTELGFAASDVGTRSLGLLIGLAVLAACWWNARTFGRTLPFCSLLLIGISALSVRTTDAIRAYGLGILCVALSFGLIWKVATAPTTRNVALASAAAVLSVQSLYQNAFLLLAVCLGGALVTVRHRLWKRTLLVLGIGLLAAISLTLYVEALAQMGELKPLVSTRVSYERISKIASLALEDGNPYRLRIWLGVSIGYIVLLGRALFASSPGGVGGSTDVVLFSSVTVSITIVSFLVWLKLLGFPTLPWYYMPPMALTCLAVDAGCSAMAADMKTTIARLCFVALGAALTIGTALSGVEVRQTNVDLLAARLRELAAPEDFILVDQWFNGATFSRYFTGATPWSTLPPLQDQTLQRLDLFKQYMVSPQPNEPVLRQVVDTLKAGHKVWLAGGLPFTKKGQAIPDLPPAPNSRVGWNHDGYSYTWAMQTAQLVQARAERATRVEVPVEHPVNPYENLPLWVVQGWRDK
jgi:hypothetical protein